MLIVFTYLLVAAGLGVLALLLAIGLIIAITKLAGWTVTAVLGLHQICHSFAAAVSEQLKTAQAFGTRHCKPQSGRIATA
jgi:hypothetical protein